MNPDEFRKIALSLAGAVESAHMNHPDFRVHGKIFASLGSPNDEWAMVKLTPDQQASLSTLDPKSFQPCAGAWGKRGYTNIRLASVKSNLVQMALEMAVDNVPAAPRSKRRKSSN